MATKNENLARVGAGIQMGAMIAQLVDSNSTGLDDKIGKIAQQIGSGCVRAASGNLNSGADILDAAADSLKDLAAEMRAGSV
jgi:hypothetical protein